MKHKIEVFTSGCPLCKEALKLVRENVCSKCTVIEYNIREKCKTGVCLKKAREYGIKAVPTIIIDRKNIIEGKPSIQQFKEIIDP
jgi:glutaredoxin